MGKWRNLVILISVHMPKAAGGSFMRSLQDHYGSSMRRDYKDRPFAVSTEERNQRALKRAPSRVPPGVRCIHGHFLPIKYSLLPGASFVTWLRHPAERMASHYYYWRRRAGKQNNLRPLQQKMMDEDWSLEQFCLCPELRDFYCLYLWRFPLSRFQFIGIVEHYEEDLQTFSSRFLGRSSKVYKDKLNHKWPGRKLGSYFEDKEDLKKKIEAFHDTDMKLYSGALETRKKGLNA